MRPVWCAAFSAGTVTLTEGKLGNIETARRMLAYMEANALF